MTSSITIEKITNDKLNLNSNSRYSLRNTFFYECFQAFKRFDPKSTISKFDFIGILQSKGNKSYILPDFEDDEILRKRSEMIFDGVRFTPIERQGHIKPKLTKESLKLVEAAGSSSGRSMSEGAKRRRYTRNILLKCFFAFNSGKEDKDRIEKEAFNILLYDQILQIPSNLMFFYDPERNEIFYDAKNSKFGLRPKTTRKNDENELKKLIDTLEKQKLINPNALIYNVTEQQAVQDSTPTGASMDADASQQQAVQDSTPTGASMDADASQQQAVQDSTTTGASQQQNFDIPVFETNSGRLVSVEDISFEVFEILDHFYGTDEKLYFELRWKSTNGQDFVDSAESASLVDCPNLIKRYVQRMKLKKLVLPELRECKTTEEPVPLVNIKKAQQKKVLDFYKQKNSNEDPQKKKKRKRN